MSENRRPDPDQLLRQAEAEEQRLYRGRLKVFLGYAGGVGKSFRMLDEGRRRLERGEDVIVGAVQANSPPAVCALLEKMEVIPLRVVTGVPVMDVEGILDRDPQVCLVDSLAYDNPAGTRNRHRWQDVEQLLQAGISVVATINLQYIEEKQLDVELITGNRPAESVPQSFLMTADEIEIVDAPPEMALQRSSDSAGDTGTKLNREHQLSQLRELALLLAAEVVDHQLEMYLHRQGIEQLWGTQERILVWITPNADETDMITSGRRNADRFQGELFAVQLNEPDLLPAQRNILEKNLALAHANGAKIETLDAEDQVKAVIRFARSQGITQIFVKRSPRSSLWERLVGSPIDELISNADGMDVRIFPC